MTTVDKKTIATLLGKYISNFPEEDLERIIEIPPPEIEYSYAFPCFRLAQIEKKPPNKIAEDLAQKIKLPHYLEKIVSAGPYLNFKVANEIVLKNIFTLKDDYGRMQDVINKEKRKSEIIIVEYPSPNTNKPLHFGHIRNMLIGKCISNLFQYKKDKVFQVNMYNDRGIHICKSMLAYQKWGNGQKPNKKPDHYVGDFYVLYSKKEKDDSNLKGEAMRMLQLWEEGDKETLDLWKEMRDWALEGHEETYQKMGISFDKVYFESDIYKKGKQIILDNLSKEVFKRTDDGAVYADLKENYNLPNKILLRSDGTSIYITQDIYLAFKKKEDFNYDKSFYVVGNPQDMYFKQLFAILDMIGFKEDKFHFSYGMVSLPEGKMKSREGTIVDADDIIKKMEVLANKEVSERYPEISRDEAISRASKIGMAALNFYILKFNFKTEFVFNPKESISFEGETGPYVQYCYARIESIINKSTVKTDLDIDFKSLKHEKEEYLIKQLNYFPEIIDGIIQTYNIHLLPQYLITLCQAFNSFYSSCQVISDDKPLEKARLLLIKCVQTVIKTGLNLLGIETLERM